MVTSLRKANTNIKKQGNSKAFRHLRLTMIASGKRSFPQFAAKLAKNLPRIFRPTFLG
jgi:hypothetical protein